MPPINDVFYFGCWDQPGHFLHNAYGSRIYEQSSMMPRDFPVDIRILDSGLLPPRLPEVEGRASLVHVNGWTILAFWDRSIDKRGKCNSAFVLRGMHAFAEAVRLSQECYPHIWKRFSFEVHPCPPH